jgi:hypothetical protein
LRLTFESIKELEGASILVYSNSMEEHGEHLLKVFQRLRENKLYAKFEKCEFGVVEVDFLGHRITQEGLKMDDNKVRAILGLGTIYVNSGLKILFRIGLVLLEVHQELCEDSHAFDKPFEEVIRIL